MTLQIKYMYNLWITSKVKSRLWNLYHFISSESFQWSFSPAMSNSQMPSLNSRNWLEFYLISLSVNFSCELGQVMTRYDFRWARWVILSNVRTDLELDLISLSVNFSCKLGQIMTRYDFLWARWVILSNVWTDLNLT